LVYIKRVCTMFILSHHLCRFDLQKTLLFTTVSIFDWIPKHRHVTSFQLWGTYRREEFEDTKCVIRIRISKKSRQHNGQKKKVQKDKQRSTKHTYKTKDRVTHLKNNRGWTQVLRKGRQFLREVIIGNVGSNWFNMCHI
jgi:hypothetical protein